MVHENDPKNIVSSILKAGRLLESFSVDRREVSLGEFTHETGLNKTTTYRLLQTLVTSGFLVRSSSGGYRLGMRLLYLGAIARADLDLRSAALPLMRGLADEFGDTAFLMIPGTKGAVTIETVVGRNPLRIHGVTVGTVLPYHVAAGPVVIAAFAPEIEARTLSSERAKLTPHTMTAATTLKKRFADVREAGFALSTEDYVVDVAAVAAPVLDDQGVAIAAISVGGAASTFREPRLAEIVKRVQYMAKKLSTGMGYY